MSPFYKNPIARRTVFSLGMALAASHFVQAQTITGTVFNDVDANGQKASTELGIAGVTVTAYRPDGTAVSPSATSAASGAYTLTGLVAATTYRIEFTNYPTAFFSAPSGSGCASSVQFAAAGAANVNFGVSYPRDFCDKNPDLVVPCYSSGDNLASAVANEKVLVKVPYTASGSSPMPSGMATASQIGPTFGTSIQRGSKKIFTATFLKRHVGLGPGGLGAIYTTDYSGSGMPTSTVWAKLQDLGQDVGVAALGARALPNSLTTSSVDASAFDLVGKAGLGSLTFSADEKTLYTINLFTQKLLKINAGYPAKAPLTLTAGDITSYSLPAVPATGGVLRPFAVKFYKGKVYVGAVATGETSGLVTDVKTYVFEFDHATSTFNPVPVLTISNMDYPKGDVHSSYPAVDKWWAWTGQWSGLQMMGESVAGVRMARPQPILSDIAFTDEGDMILGFMDRTGHQLGYKQKSTVSGDTKVYNGYIGGDLLRARIVSGSWALESNGTVGGTLNGCGKGNNQGPGGGEFYCGDNYSGVLVNGQAPVEIHQETFEGGMVVVPGTNQVVATVMDPLAVWSGGFTWFSNTDGNSVKRYQIYESTNANQGTLGKANGLGVTDAICSPPPLEIGNRVWKDTDGDGVQDPNEPPLKGVTVKLYAADGTTVLATAVTDATGNFYFNSGTGTSTASKIYAVNLQPETNYFLKITALGSDPSVAGITLASVAPGGTPGLNAGNSIANNDATLVSGLPSIQLKTGVQGENNHSYDFAFVNCTLNVVAASNSPVCQNAAINLTATGASGSATYAWTGPNAFVSTVQNPVINSANASKSGTYTVIVNDGGCKDTATVAVTVTSISATATGGTGCSGGTVALTATAAGAATFSWSGPAGFTSSQQNPSLSPLTAGMAGTYTVTATTSGGCTATATAAVAVNTITAAATGGGAVCPGGTISLGATGGTTYSWEGPNSFVSNTQNPTITGATAAMAGSYFVTVTTAAGCTAVASVAVTVGSPTATATSNSAVCTGGTINLTATGGGTYSWTGPNGFTSTAAAPTITGATAAMAGIYYVTVTTAGGCTATASTTVVVNSVTAFAEGGAACTGGSIQLTSSGGTSYSWSGPSGFTSTSQNPLRSPAVAGTYTVTVTSNGCTATATATVTLVATPTASVSATVLCEGGAIQLMASNGAQSYSWTGPNGWTSSQQNPVIPNANALYSGNYDVTMTGSGCNGTASIPVTVNAKPAASAGSNSPVCLGNAIDLTASGGGTYSWTGPNGFVSAAQNPSVLNANSANAGTYKVTVTSVDGCTATDETVVAVNSATASASTSTPSVCIGAAINLSASGGGTYSWSGPNGFTSTGQNPAIATATASASGTYTVTVTATGGCTAIASTAVEVKTVSAAATSTSPVCEGDMLLLNGPDNMTSYSWTGPNGFASALQSPKFNYALPAFAGNYSLVVTGTNGCTASATIAVVVNPLPHPTADKPVLCIGETLNLHANGASSPMWTGPNGFASTSQNPSIAFVSTAQSGTYFLKNGATGCIEKYDVLVTEGAACIRNFVEVVASDSPDPTNIYANNSSTEDDDAAAMLCFADCVKPVFILAQAQAACVNGAPGSTVLNLTGISNGTHIGYSLGETYSGPAFASATALSGATYSIVLPSPASPTYYTVRVYNGGQCCFTDQTYLLLPSPCATATNNGPVCMENAVQLTATGGGTYSWSGPGGFTSTDQSPIVAAPAAAGTYTVTVTVGAFTATASTIVDIYTMPTVTAMSNSPVPYGQPINLAATSVPTYSSYAWSGPNSFSSNSQYPVVTSGAATGGTYSVTVTDDHGCTKSASTAVTAQPPAPCSVTGTIGGPTVLCEGDTLNMTSSGGKFYAWSGPNGWTSAVQNPYITDVAPIHSGTYSVTVTGADGSCTDVKTLTLLVNPRPRPAPSATDSTVCAGQKIELFAQTGTGGTFMWTGPNSFSSAVQNPVIPNATTAMTGLYFVKMTSTTGGCTGRDSVFITVDPSPILADATTAICAGQSTDLTALVPGYAAFSNKTWKKGTVGGPTESSPASVSPAATTDYFLLVTNDAGCVDTAKITVTVNPLPTPTATATPATGQICAGQPLLLNATGGGTYSWSGPSSFTSTAASPSVSTITTAGTGTYFVTVTSAAGCSAVANVAVSVIEVTAAATGAPACAGGDIVLGATGGGSYSWSGPNSFASTAQNPTITGADFSKAGIYTVTVTSATGGCTDVATVNITVTPVGATATTTAPVCEGQSFQLFANNGGTSYSWTGPNSFASTAQNPVVTGATAAMSGTYNLTVSGSGGCTGTASVAVVINPLPIPTATNNGPICADATLNLTATGGASYSWSGPNAFSSAAQNPTILNAPASLSGTYNVTATSAAGCTATASTPVLVNQAMATAGAADASVCVGLPINLTATGGGTYSWSGPDGFSSAAQNPVIASATLLKQGIYTVTVTGAGGCTATASISISVNKATATATVAPVCTGGDLEFQATGGASFAWSGPNAFSSTLQNPVKTAAALGDAGSYTVTVTDGNGCTATASATAVVNDTPTAAASAANVCAGGTIQLQSSGGAFEWNWTGPGGFTSTLQNPQISNATAAQSGTYNVTVTGVGSCAGAASVAVTVNPNPAPTITGAGAHCQGASFSLGTATATSYAWSGPGGFLSAVQNPAIANFQPAMSGPYFLTVTDANGCSGTATTPLLINVNSASATANSPVCAGGTLNLVSGAGASWNWTGPDGFTSAAQNPSIPAVTSAKSGTYNVTATDASGCTATASVVVVVKTVSPTISVAASCAGFPINLTATGGGTYSWEGPNSFSSNIQNPMIAEAVAADFGAYTVTVTANGCSATATQTIVEGPDCLGFDYGDLPDVTSGIGSGDYQTLKPYFAASHRIVAGLKIGTSVDAELTGQPNSPATGDGADEDGVTIPSFTAGLPTTVTATATNTTGMAATLYGFIDWNNDGDFDDAGEKAQVAVPSGSNGATFLLVFNVPSNAAAGPPIGARFRLSSDPVAASPVGQASSGEVEDYILQVCPAPTCIPLNVLKY